MVLKQGLLAAAGAVAVGMSCADAAEAASFGFSFSNENGQVNGIVEGTIELPDGDGVFAATSVVVTSAPAALGYTLPEDFLGGNYPAINLNRFEVSGGAIVSVLFSAINPGQEGLVLLFNTPASLPPYSALNSVGSNDITSGVWDINSNTVQFTSLDTPSVPEPVSLLSLFALAGVAAGTALQKQQAASANA
jgi:hypothetical protein